MKSSAPGICPSIAGPSGLHFTAVLGSVLLLINGCAKVGAPTGGQKDENPPVFVEGTPENRSVNFDGKELELVFDEYIQLKDLNQELLVSPPLQKRPIVRIRDKSIRMTLNNELLPQTTYTVNFGNAIADLNEGNLLPDFEFVFSTGNHVDSLSVTGKALNAFDMKPVKEEVWILLYENLQDSAPLLEIPRYIGKVSKTGLFSVNNIPPDTFRLFALRDQNNNRIYDPGSESIGFLDSLLMISADKVTPVTYIKDTVKIIHHARKGGRSGRQDAAQKSDTTIAPGRKLNAVDIAILYFQEESKKVFINSKSRESPEKIHLTFSRPPHDTASLTPLNFRSETGWFIKESSRRCDTITYWITDSLIAKRDTLMFAIEYLTTDSLNRFIERRDTISLKYKEREEKAGTGRRSRSSTTAVKKEVMAMTSTLTNRGTQELNRPVVFYAERPLGVLKPENIEMYRFEDTLALKQKFNVTRDSFNIRAFNLGCTWQEAMRYKLLLKPGAAADIYGLSNDSIELTFTTRNADYYGRILVNFGSDHFPILLQLLDTQEKMLKQKPVTSPGLVVFDFLDPGKYILKAVYDVNENLQWDTGNYLQHLQPEPVYYHIMTDAVRSNWDHEISWMIKD
jgi:hypothetical protein